MGESIDGVVLKVKNFKEKDGMEERTVEIRYSAYKGKINTEIDGVADMTPKIAVDLINVLDRYLDQVRKRGLA